MCQVGALDGETNRGSEVVDVNGIANAASPVNDVRPTVEQGACMKYLTADQGNGQRPGPEVGER